MVCPAKVAQAALTGAGAGAPEAMVGAEDLGPAEAVVAPSSMVEAILPQRAVADTSAVAQAVAAEIMAMMALAQAVEEVEDQITPATS